MSALRLAGSVMIVLLVVRQVGAAPASQPALADQVATLLKQLDSDSWKDRDDAIHAAIRLPIKALPLFQAAEKQPGISDELRQNLDTVIKALQRAASKQLRYQIGLDFYRGHLVSEYDRIGKKDASWTEPVHNLLEATARLFADELRDRDVDAEPLRFVGPVFRSKCDDPLVLLCEFWVGRLPSLRDINAADAAILASQYSTYIKLKALAWMTAHVQESEVDQDLHTQAIGYLKQSIDLWPAALAEEPKMPSDIVLEQAQDQIESGKALGLERKDIFHLVDAALSKALPEESLVRLNLKGKFLVDYAWDARGTGWASTITDDGAKAFAARLADADKTLSRCYELFPDDAHAATEMLSVELGQGQRRQRMEIWFDRAMKADPENYEACEAKMWYLSPQWYGSLGDQLAFGRECLASWRFKCRIPLLVIDAHFNSATPSTWASEIPWPYFARDDVWKDISNAYDGYLEQHPDAWNRRGKYAYYAWLAGKQAEALKQYQALEAGPGSYRQSDMLRVVKIELAMHPPGQIAADPTSRSVAVARKNTDDLKRIMVDAYDQIGSKNPKWDAAARAALLAAAKDWGKDPDRDFSERDTVLQSTKQAIDAGCDDPLVRFVYSYTVDTFVTPDRPHRKQTSFADGIAVVHSRYPAFIRLRAVTWGTSGKIWKTKMPEQDRAAVFAAIDDGMATLKQAVGDHSVSDGVFAPQVNELLRCYMGMLLEGKEPLIRRAQVELEAGHITAPVMNRIRIRYYHDYWDGIGLVKVLNRKKGEGLHTDSIVDLTDFERGWEQIWQDDPIDPYAAEQILRMSRATPEPEQRPWLDFWIHEALRADPHSYETGLEVLNQLRWAEASYEDTESFCQQAVDTSDYRSQIPFLMVDHLDQYARQGNDDPTVKTSADIIGDPDNWSKIAGIYEAYLAQFPLDSSRRSEYASYACLIGQWPLAAQQFKLLGDHVKPKAFYSNERLAACLKRVKALTDSDMLPTSQRAAQ
jgi:hypothetical protein